MTTISIVCIAIAFLLVHLPRFLAAAGMMKADGHYNNNDPRGQQAATTGWPRRALNAHYNTIENFPPFAIAVVVANLGKASPTAIAVCSILFVVVRSLYIVVYIADLASVRTVLWTMGLCCTFALFLLPLF
jgi:uncharacterized MAPEG superfamily protein